VWIDFAVTILLNTYHIDSHHCTWNSTCASFFLDNQEAWQDVEKRALLVVEFLEYQSHVDNASAVKYFWDDLCETTGSDNAKNAYNDATFFINEISDISVRIPGVSPLLGSGHCCGATGRKHDGNIRFDNEQDHCVELCLIRLPHVQTDLLVTLSTPSEQNLHVHGFPSETFRNAVSSLVIQDWGLFNNSTE
jgi:hypothetical protein